MNKKKLVGMLSLILLILLGSFIAYRQLQGGGEAGSPAFDIPAEPSTESSMPTEEEMEGRRLQNDIILPVGKLLITSLRAEYQDEELRLVVPKLELDVPVYDDTTLPTLTKGPGLYKYAQIPNIYNTNVSIAAHRDLYGCEFYYLDTVGEGDYIYLVYKDKVFQYAYRDTTIIKDNDWDAIRSSYDCRVTLTTCDPIGTSLNRMVVVGELVAYEDYHADYEFK